MISRKGKRLAFRIWRTGAWYRWRGEGWGLHLVRPGGELYSTRQALARGEAKRVGLLVFIPLPHDYKIDRADLLKHPEEDDACDVFERGEPAGDCASDGHYLCWECSEREPEDRRAE